MKQALEIVKGKTVALVGNAMSINYESPAKAIDAHEVVIRMNMGIPGILPTGIIGTRTTIWATAKRYDVLSAPCELLLFMKLTPLGDKHWGQLLMDHRDYPMERWPKDLEDEVKAFVGADPGTGIRLLYWLKRKAEPKAVTVFGMDCWKTTTNYSNRMHTPNHSPDLEWAAMERLLA